MKKYFYRWIFLIFAGILYFAGNAFAALSVGVIRWDAWGKRGKIPTEISLSPEKYHHRVPFFGNLNDPHLSGYGDKKEKATVSFGGDTQEVVDQELAYANDAGIDYFAFVYYAPDAELSYARKLYKSSQHKGNVKYTYIIGEVSDHQMSADEIAALVADLRDPHWKKVLSNRPLLFVMSSGLGKTAEKTIKNLNAAYSKAYPDAPPIYYALTQYADGDTMKNLLWQSKAQAGSAYCTWNRGNEGDHSFKGMADREREMWQSYAAAQTKIIPWVTLGFDRRPRIDYVMPWESYQPNNWCHNATPAEAKEQLRAAFQFVKEHPQQAEANTILLYSWNEDDEGQGIVPKLIPNGEGINREMLDAVKQVIRSAN